MSENKKEMLRNMMSDERGQLSSKRILAYICTLTLCVVMILNSIFTKTITPSAELVNAVMMIACTCIGSTAVDKFSYKGEPNPEA